MSTVLTREREHRTTRPASRIRARHAERTASATRGTVHAVARPKRRSRLGAWLAKAVFLGVVGLVSMGSSTLLGQTLMEQQRREGLRAQERAQQSRVDAALLRARVARLTSLKTIDDWAAMRGFAQSGGAVVVPQEPTRVATLR